MGVECLRFWLRHREDMRRLNTEWAADFGPEASDADWANLDRLCGLAAEQGGTLLTEWLARAIDSLAATKLRVSGATRADTASRRWDAVARLRGPGSRGDDAIIGVTLDMPSPLGNDVHVYLAHCGQRFVRGPAVYEALRRTGANVRLADGRSAYAAWSRGTVLLGAHPFGESDDPEAVGRWVTSIVDSTLVANWEAIAPLVRRTSG